MIDFDEILNAPLMDAFGVKGTVTPRNGGDPFEHVFSLSRNVGIVEMGQTLAQPGAALTLSTRFSALPVGRTLEQGDVVSLETPNGATVVTIFQSPDVDESGFAVIGVKSGIVEFYEG